MANSPLSHQHAPRSPSCMQDLLDGLDEELEMEGVEGLDLGKEGVQYLASDEVMEAIDDGEAVIVEEKHDLAAKAAFEAKQAEIKRVKEEVAAAPEAAGADILKKRVQEQLDEPLSRPFMEELYKLTLGWKDIIWVAQPGELYWEPAPSKDSYLRTDVSTRKGVGKSCAHSLGVRHSDLKLHAYRAGGRGLEPERVPEEDVLLSCCDLLKHSITGKLGCLQTESADFVTSRKEISDDWYGDCKLAQFQVMITASTQKPRADGKHAWNFLTSAATEGKPMPFRLKDCCAVRKYSDAALEVWKLPDLTDFQKGQLVKFVQGHDKELYKLQASAIRTQDSFAYVRGWHNLFKGDPVGDMWSWRDREINSKTAIIADQTAHDCLQDLQEPFMKPKGDGTVTKAIWDGIVKALGPKRQMANRVATAQMGFELNLPQKQISLKLKEKPSRKRMPTGRSRQQREEEEEEEELAKEAPNLGGRRAGALQRKKAAPTDRTTRNTASATAAGTVQGAAPLPAHSELPEHLRDVAATVPQVRLRVASPTSSSSSSLPSHPASVVSDLSHCVTELRADINSLKQVALDRKAEEAAKKAASTDLQVLKKELDAKEQVITELRVQLGSKTTEAAGLEKQLEQAQKEEKKWENMCTNMLGTIGGMMHGEKAERKIKKDK